jgi:hypothetical protein
MLKKITAATTAAVGTLLTVAQVAWAQNLGSTIQVKTPTGFFTNFGTLFTNILRIVMVIAALLVFFYLVLGGIEYITSGGEKGKTEAARNKITSAVIGLIILAASYAILTLALNFLGFRDLQNVFDSTTIEAPR